MEIFTLMIKEDNEYWSPAGGNLYPDDVELVDLEEMQTTGSDKFSQINNNIQGGIATTSMLLNAFGGYFGLPNPNQQQQTQQQSGGGGSGAFQKNKSNNSLTPPKDNTLLYVVGLGVGGLAVVSVLAYALSGNSSDNSNKKDKD
jgi:hypothetical protein